MRLPPNDASFGYRYPAAQYDHDDTTTFFTAIAGAAVYRGSASSLFGEMPFGEIVDGTLFHVSVLDLLTADDGDSATTASINALGVLRDGATSSIVDIVGDALGNPSASRTDLRIAVAPGEIYITTKQDAFVRKLVPVEIAYPNGWSLAGVADGNQIISFSVSGVALQIVTTAGQTATEVAEAMANAILLDGTPQSLEIYGHGMDERLHTNGTATGLMIGDSGISQVLPPSLPALGSLGLALLLAGTRASNDRRCPRPTSSRL